MTPSQQRVRPSFAACRLCKAPGCWRLMDAWSGCLASKSPAAAPRATSSATSKVERWHANPPLAAATTDVDDQDLSRVVLFNGGGRATANATPELRALEQQARSTRVGI